MSKSGWGELPPGWDRAEVGELSEIIRGVSFPSGVKTDTPKDGYVACLRTANVQRQVEWRDLWFVPSSYVKRESQIIQPDDILISTANSRELVGKVAQVTHIPHHSTLGAFISLIRFPSGLNRRLFFYELSSSAIQANIRDMASTTTNISNVSTAKLATLVLQVPPYPEQHRIAAEIEKHFTRLDAAVAALKRVRANLKRYRASVLKAACEGRLVPTEAELARAEGREYEAADVLLDRVLRERRERSEADQLAKMEAAGKPPKGDRWKAKYKEPEAPDTTGLHDLPDGWVWASLDSACLRIGDVDHKMPSSAAGGIPYVSTKDFHGSDGIDFDDAKKISQNDYDRLSRKIRPEENDLLLSRYGTVGLVRRVRVKTAFQVSYSIAILKSLGAPSIIRVPGDSAAVGPIAGADATGHTGKQPARLGAGVHPETLRPVRSAP